MAKKRSSKHLDPDVFLLRALEHARGLADSGSTSFVPTGEVQQTSTGITVVHLRQVYAGIPVVDSSRSVRFDPDGAVTHFTGSTVTVTDGTPVLPELGPAAAAHAAFLGLLGQDSIPPDLTFSAAPPEVVAAIPVPSRATVLRKTPFVEPILAALVIDASARASRLLWDVRLGLPGGAGTWVVHVAATGDRPEVLSIQRLSAHAIRGDVFEYDPRSERAARVPFPKPRTSYPWFGGRPLPHPDWVEQDLTDGNNARAIVHGAEPIRGARTGDDLVFTTGTAGDRDHWVINAFYWCNVMHDFFHLLGFDERAGNFQRRNHLGGDGAGDPLSVVARDEVISGLAFFQNRPDGTSPTLELGRFHRRHTALDADIVIHEFVHGVTSRVIGGKDVHTPLTKPQSQALGEGFSDYYAISIQNWFRRQAGQPEEWIYGAWLADRPTGLRTASYEGYPNTYGFLRKPHMKPHIAGEVWCATLLDLNEALRDGGSRDQGDERGWQLVFDSLCFLHPGQAGPHFLHGRDAILSAFDGAVAQGSLPAALKETVFEVFKKRGMGPAARSPDAGFRAVVEAFE